MSKRESRNPDYIKGINFPLQTYAFSGSQFGSSMEIVNGKRRTDKAPMTITSQPPGASAKDDGSWQLTFGASHDAIFTLFNGAFFNTTSLFNIPLNLGGIYRDGIGTGDQNIYEQAGGVQQIQYVVSKGTAAEGRDAETFGDDVDEARGIGMRIPMMAGGWGRTIGMRPTDPEPTEDDKKRRNDDEHKLARETWKYGPVDVRWDERRGVWGAWNDLITDHNDENLGTMVFDTNPDETSGFPFLKGKLDDVWKVIVDEARPEGIDSDTEQSGAVATHLNHRWVEQNTEGEWIHANLKSAFTIHRDSIQTGTCGNETFKISDIEILTRTFFHLSDTYDGPIAFSSAAVNDNDLTGFMKFDGIQWVPTLQFEACDKVGFELAVLYENDKVLADKIIEVCKLLLRTTGNGNGSGGSGGGPGGTGGGNGPNGGISPEEAEAAGQLSRDAAETNTAAEGILIGVGASGSGPGGDFAEGDFADPLAPEGGELTAGEAAALNESIPIAQQAYADAAAAQTQAATDIEAAGVAQAEANTASDNLGDAQAAADAAELAVDNNPGNTTLEDANVAAQEARAQAESDYHGAQEASDGATEIAEGSHEAAVEASDAAKAAGQKVKEDGGGKLPDDVIDGINQADQDNDAANEGRSDAGLEEVTPPATPAELVEAAKAELNAKIDGLACEKIEDLNALANAVGNMVQKAMEDMSTAVNIALGESAEELNQVLGGTVGRDTEAGTGGLVGGIVETPPVCPVEAVGSGKVVPGLPTDPAEAADDDDDDDPDNGSGEDPGDPSGGSTIAGPPTGSPTSPPVPPRSPPTCPSITLKNPCGPGISNHGPGGRRGTSRVSGPGTIRGSMDGGVNSDGDVFGGIQQQGLNLGAVNRPLDLSGGLGLA